MLTNSHLNDVCLLYNDSGNQCRYLGEDRQNWAWHCLKHHPTKKTEIDVEIKKMLDECSKKGSDPHAQGLSCGDNCSGYPRLKHMRQGYDVD